MGVPEKIVIVGGGLAAANAVEELRAQGYAGAITLVGAETHLPYERPPLSKDVLLGKAEVDSTVVHPRDWYDEHDTTLMLGQRATGLDLTGRVVSVGDQQVPYDKLLLATGSQPRHLDVVDASGAPTAYLRTIEDATALRPTLTGTVLILGAGWIGLEVASAARQAGAEVVVVDPAPVPLAQVMGDQVGAIFAALHQEHGVDLRTRTSLASIVHTDDDTRVTLSDGTLLHPDLVVVGIGVVPDVALAETAGLGVDDGILVDATLRTSDPDVFAAGDVAHHDHPSFGRIRVEHWDAAINQGKHAARAMLGVQEPYAAAPYFFTDQYDWGMEYVGHVRPGGYDELILRGEAPSGLTAFWVDDGRIVAGMHLNDWDAIDPIRALVGSELDERLRDPAVPLVEVGGAPA